MAGDRAKIVAALAGIEGVTAAAKRPAAAQKGSAWPVWVDTTNLTACGLLDTWWVFVCVAAGDELSVIEAGDALLLPVWDALAEIAEVQICEGVSVPVSQTGTTQLLPALRYTITTTRDREVTP